MTDTASRVMANVQDGVQAEREIKEWIVMGNRTNSIIGVPYHNLDLTNMATLINYLNVLGLVTDIERIKMISRYGE